MSTAKNLSEIAQNQKLAWTVPAAAAKGAGADQAG